MPGVIKKKIELLNKLCKANTKVNLVCINNEYINLLFKSLKELREAVYKSFEFDDRLKSETDVFIGVCRKASSTLSNYKCYFFENNIQIVKYFSFTKRKIYMDLHSEYINPIIDTIKLLRTVESNAYQETIEKLVKTEGITSKDTYIVTRGQPLLEKIKFENQEFKLISEREFLNLDIYVDNIIFIGSINYFDSKFSRIFFARKNYFLSYSCFENRLIKSNFLSDFIDENVKINTLYDDVAIKGDYIGLNLSNTLKLDKNNLDEQILSNINEHNLQNIKEKQVKARLFRLSNNNYIFLPVEQKAYVIDVDSLRLTLKHTQELLVGDLLVLRESTATNLIRDIANKILGKEAAVYRENLEKWKRRLRHNVNKKGVKRVSRILVERYGILVGKEGNIRNWMSEESIKPTCLPELLQAFNFSDLEVSEIMNSASALQSAHISAGHQVTDSLIHELDRNLERVINEKGFYVFKSKEFEGANFNIEQVRQVSDQTYYIKESEQFKINKL